MQQGQGTPPQHIMSLFTRANYQFSSKAEGRPSTFYFTDVSGNRGRYRRQHARGPELVFQGPCKRLFISPEMEAKISVLAHIVSGSDDDEPFISTRYGKIADIYPVLTNGDPNHVYGGKASLNVVVGWRLFDTNDSLVHFSAGQIVEHDDEAREFFMVHGDAGVQAYSGPWTIW